MSRCAGSNRKVSKAARKGSLFVGGAWLAGCPKCDGTVTWSRTDEIDKRTRGHVYRYAEHEESKA